jgi:hypothetical protein
MGTIPNAGLDAMATLLTGGFPYMANGTDSTAEAYTDTALGVENTLYGAARKAGTASVSSVGICTWNTTFYFTNNVTVREYGIFSEPSGGTMLYRRVLASNRNYVDGDSMEVNVSHTYTRS